MVPFSVPALLLVALSAASNVPRRSTIVTLTVTTTVQYTQIVYAPGPPNTPITLSSNYTWRYPVDERSHFEAVTEGSYFETVDVSSSIVQKPSETKEKWQASVTSVPALATRGPLMETTAEWPKKTKYPVPDYRSTPTNAKNDLNYENGGKLIIGARPPVAATSRLLAPTETPLKPAKTPDIPVSTAPERPVSTTPAPSELSGGRGITLGSILAPRTGEKGDSIAAKTTPTTTQGHTLVWDDFGSDSDDSEDEDVASFTFLAATSTPATAHQENISHSAPGSMEKEYSRKTASGTPVAAQVSPTTAVHSKSSRAAHETAAKATIPVSSLTSHYARPTASSSAKVPPFSRPTVSTASKRLFPANKTISYKSAASKEALLASFGWILPLVAVGMVLLCNFH